MLDWYAWLAWAGLGGAGRAWVALGWVGLESLHKWRFSAYGVLEAEMFCLWNRIMGVASFSGGASVLPPLYSLCFLFGASVLGLLFLPET